MSMTYVLDIRPDGRTQGIGVDIGIHVKLAAVRYEDGQPAFVVLRAAGQKHWTGRGMDWRYAPAELRFYRVLNVQGEWDRASHGRLKVERLLDVPVRDSQTTDSVF